MDPYPVDIEIQRLEANVDRYLEDIVDLYHLGRVRCRLHSNYRLPRKWKS